MPDYTDVDFIVLKENNKIQVQTADDNYYLIERKHDDNGMLYIPEKGKICFFPTNWAANHDKDGIEAKWIKRNLFQSYTKNKIKHCTG